MSKSFGRRRFASPNDDSGPPPPPRDDEFGEGRFGGDVRGYGADVYAPEHAEAGYGPVDGEAPRRRGGLVILVSLAVTAAIGAVMWNAYQQGVREGGREAAPQLPALADGGATAETRDQAAAEPRGSSAYNVLNVAPPADDAAAAGAPTPFDIAARDGAPAQSGGAGGPESGADEPPLNALGRPLLGGDAAPAPVEGDPDYEPALGEPAGVDTLNPAAAAGDPAPARVVVEREPIAEPAPSTPAPQDPPPAAPAQSDLASLAPPPGGERARGPEIRQPTEFLVQIASFTQPDQASQEWFALSERYPQLFGARTADIAAADLGPALGLRYRLRVAGFRDEVDATIFCNDLKARGRGCLVVRR